MNYTETVQYLFAVTPSFQNIGGAAYKPGLERVQSMAAQLGNPHEKFKTIHIAGTNGKGSTSSVLAATLSAAGYKTGLFTSPHLVDFRERIRIDGLMISEEEVVDFVPRVRALIDEWQPSFFELTTLMAFDHFARHGVEIAVIETGMGGRLDSTNIISPLLSVITNVSLDHTQYLGNTLEQIAEEKAGIIKFGIPVVIGEARGDVRKVFEQKATEVSTNIHFVEDNHLLVSHARLGMKLKLETVDYGNIEYQLGGKAQVYNAQTILMALRLLSEQIGLKIDRQAVSYGFAHVIESTGLRGRWEQLSLSPHIVCDTGHNAGGVALIADQLQREEYKTLRIVFGMVADKDVTGVLGLLPRYAEYYFCAPDSERAIPSQELASIAAQQNINGRYFPSVAEAVQTAITESDTEDFIYIGGSNFVVAELLSMPQFASPETRRGASIQAIK